MTAITSGAAPASKPAASEPSALRAALTRALEVTAPARTAVGNVLRVVSPFGWLVLALALTLGFLGRHYRWLEVWVLALAAMALLLVAAVFILGRSAYAVTIDLAQRRVVVGERAVGRIDVANASPRPLLPARIELPVGAGLAAFRLPRLTPQASHEELFTIPTSRRGVIVVGPVLSVRGDALNLLRREVRWTDPVDLFVHPRTVNLDGASSGFLKDIEGLPTRDLSSSDVSFHALREYVPGDDRRSIHWKTTARTGRLMVRQYEETRRSHLVVALSTHPGDYAEEAEFELAISAAGSLALQAIREEKQVTVITPGGVIPGISGQRLLDELSTIELDPLGTDLSELTRSAANEVPGASSVALIAGSVLTPTAWRGSANHIPLGALGFAVCCAPEQEVSRRSLGDLVLVGLPTLADLPRMMRRVGA